MPAEAAVNEQTILKDCPRMGLDDRFAFRCGPDMACFTRCCHDVTIVLTPYDLLRLRRATGLDSSELLEKHTLRSNAAGGQKFPLVILKMDGAERSCPFLCEKGCGVYNDRPWACRMYPLGSAQPKCPTANDRAFHFIVKENLCKGHAEECTVSVREWLENQGIEQFDMMSTGFKELTLHDFWDGDKALKPQQADMFYMACYDLDRFRRFIFETRFLQLFEVDEARIEALRNDDEELLEFGMQWLRFVLFHERTMKIRNGVVVEGGAK